MANGDTNIDTIIEGCKSGNRQSQEKLYRSFFGVMMSLCLRYTRSEDDAMEVLNTGFFKVYKNISRFDPGKATLYTWIRTIMINTCLDFIRERQRSTTTSMELDQAIDVQIPPEIISKMKSTEILQLVRELPPSTSAVFNLYVMEGYNHREIGKLLGISEGTSKWHLSEARKSLQKKIMSLEKK